MILFMWLAFVTFDVGVSLYEFWETKSEKSCQEFLFFVGIKG